MSKNYDLYPASERKIDNWRRRILGYEKMKRDMQRQIQILKNKNKKQKEVIDKATNELFILKDMIYKPETREENFEIQRKISSIIKRLNGKEVAE